MTAPRTVMGLNDGTMTVVVMMNVLPSASCEVIGGDTLSVVVMATVSWLVAFVDGSTVTVVVSLCVTVNV